MRLGGLLVSTPTSVPVHPPLSSPPLTSPLSPSFFTLPFSQCLLFLPPPSYVPSPSSPSSPPHLPNHNAQFNPLSLQRCNDIFLICAAMTGVMGDLKESRELFLQSSRLVKRKNNNLEKFCYRRVSVKQIPTHIFDTQINHLHSLFWWWLHLLPVCIAASIVALVAVGFNLGC